ncbi:MAG: Gx transporter family protein [Treponema sp.]|nr:Gx transporter family protein [Treponema sp.]
MQFQNKNKIAYLGALTLLFSYAEMLLPRFTPFFRIGLGNIAILLAFDLNPLSFMLLTLIKAFASSLMAGTLFSPFFLISLGQSFFSGMMMYLLARLNRKCKNKLFSLYGISILGSAVSALIQIFLSTLYLGKGTYSLLGPMLLFSLFSGIITAFFSLILHIPEQAPNLIRKENVEKKQPVLLLALLILSASAAIFMIKNLIILSLALILALILQLISGRKIYIFPHISLWIFVVISTLFIPNGEVLIKIGTFSITKGSLIMGITKALKLSIVSALSQCAASLKPRGDRPLALVLAYFTALSNLFRSSQGNFIQKFKTTLQAQNLTE